MPKQKVPDIDFNWWVVAELVDLFKENNIYINEAYQRGDIWKQKPKIELIKSINNRYSIGVIVLYINDSGKYEILDGQQRLLTIKQYLEGTLELKDSGIVPYDKLVKKEKALLDAYCIYFIRLKSQDPDTKEEDIIQTFLRLQEGTPLNKAEKLNAYRGKFKEVFKEIRETHPIFLYLGKEKRFRWRQLAAELLTLEIDGDFKNKVFPSLDLESMKKIVQKYEIEINERKVRTFKSNLDFLNTSLNVILTAFQPREFISFYLLASYLRKYIAGKENLMNEFSEFAEDFLKNLNSFAIYDKTIPKGMSKKIFDEYMSYKNQSKIMTTADSLQIRLKIMLGEFNRIKPFIIADKKRLFDTEQKRTLYFRQKGLCGFCGKKMVFRLTTGHHIFRHSQGGKTDDLNNAVLLHENCHKRVENQINRGIIPVFPYK